MKINNRDICSIQTAVHQQKEVSNKCKNNKDIQCDIVHDFVEVSDVTKSQPSPCKCVKHMQ